MKRMLPTTQYYFNSGSSNIDFSMYPDFDPKRLLAIINTSRNQTLIYATGGGSSSPTRGEFYGSIGAYFLNLVFNTSSMADTDILELIYDESVGMEEAKASIDIVSGKSGLDVNLLNSSFGGTIGDVMPAPFQDNALSIGVLNGGVLSAPAMNVNNELIIDATQSGPVPVTFSGVGSTDLITFGGGTPLSGGSPLPATPTNPSTGSYMSFGPGAVTPDTQRVIIASDQSQLPVLIKDQVVSGAAISSSVGNLLTGGITLTDTTNYTNVTCQIITTAGASGSILFESSMDGANFKTIPMTDTTGLTTNGAISISGASTTIYSGNLQGIWFRVRSATGFGAGTARAFATFSAESSNASLLSLDTKIPSIGGNVTSNSMPVNIAADQIVPVRLPDLFVTGQAAQSIAVNNILTTTAGTTATDAAGYRSASVHVISTATAGTYVFEGSNDNINFQTIPVLNQSNINGSITNAGISATASQILYIFPIQSRYIRLRISSSLTGGNIQAFSRLSQAPFSPPTTIVTQGTNTNLTTNANIVSGTVTTVSTVSAVSSCNLAASQTTDIASAAIATTVTSANFNISGTQASSMAVYVTAISGAGAFMDVEVQESMDGSNYYTIYTFERITATGQYYSPVIKSSSANLRYIRTIGGTTPSVTNSINRTQRSGAAETIRRFINRTIDPNTLNSVTGTFLCEGVEDFNLIVRCTAQTTAATIALQFSTDGTNWFTTPTTVTTVAGIVRAGCTNEQWKFVRAIVTAAGSGITLDNVYIAGHSA